MSGVIVFDIIEGIKQLKWKYAGHITRRQNNRSHTNTLQCYLWDVKDQEDVPI